MLSELEELRASFTEEIIKNKNLERELERTKTVLWALIYHSMAGQAFIPEQNLTKNYKFNIHKRSDQTIVIEVDLDED